MADLYIIGQILSANSFLEPNLFCKWSVQFGNFWSCVEGITEGQTITDSSKVVDQESVFVHPLDIHLLCRGLQVNGQMKMCKETDGSLYSRAGLNCTLKCGLRIV